MPGRFREIAIVPETQPMFMWGGAAGELTAIYLSTGGRMGGSSKIFRHVAAAGDQSWVDDGAPAEAETLCKMRDLGGRLYCFYETAGPILISKEEANPGGWSFDGSLPALAQDNFVGGHGLEVSPSENIIWLGGGGDWNDGSQHGIIYQGAPGGPWNTRREFTPGILWACERDPEGHLWEFWHGGWTAEAETHTFIDATEIDDPTTMVSSATPFLGSMYAAGKFGPGEEAPSSTVWKYSGGWSAVHSFSQSIMCDHIVAVPRTQPELYAIGSTPFQVYRSLDGSTWEAVELPVLNTGEDSNNHHLTACGYYKGRVFIAARDEAINQIRIYADGAAEDLILQII